MKYLLVGLVVVSCVSYGMQNQLDIIEQLETTKEELLMTPLYSSISDLDNAIKALRSATPGQERTKMRLAERWLNTAAANLSQKAHLDYPAERDAVDQVRSIHRQVQQWNNARSNRPRTSQHPLRESHSPSGEDQKENIG